MAGGPFPSFCPTRLVLPLLCWNCRDSPQMGLLVILPGMNSIEFNRQKLHKQGHRDPRVGGSSLRNECCCVLSGGWSTGLPQTTSTSTFLHCLHPCLMFPVKSAMRMVELSLVWKLVTFLHLHFCAFGSRLSWHPAAGRAFLGIVGSGETQDQLCFCLSGCS